MTRTHAALITVLLCTAPLAQARAAAPAIPESLRACSRLQDSLQRLVCYDREIASQPASAPTAAAPPAATPSAVVPPAVAAPAAAPRLGDELVAARSDPGSAKAQSSLTAVVTAMRELPQGTYAITLDNGQLWRQLEKVPYFPLSVGETVRIDRGMLGSYQLTRIVEGSNRFVRVTRVK